MKLETPLVAVLLGIGVFVSLFTFIFTIADTNGVTYDLSDFETAGGTSFYNSFDKFNETKTNIDNIKTDFEDTTLSDGGDVFTFLKMVFDTSLQLLGSLDIVKEIFTSLGTILGIDPLWIGIFTTILIVSMMVLIIMILSGRTY